MEPKILGQQKDITLVSISYKEISFLILLLKNYYYFLNKNYYNNFLKSKLLEKNKKINRKKFFFLKKKKLVSFNLKNLVDSSLNKKYNTKNFLFSFKDKNFDLRKEAVLRRLIDNKYQFFVKQGLRERLMKKGLFPLDLDLDKIIADENIYYENQNIFVVTQEVNFQNLKNKVYSNLFNNLMSLNRKMLKKTPKFYTIFKRTKNKLLKKTRG